MSATPIANAKAPSPATSAARAARLPWWGLLALSAAAFSAVLTEQLPAGLLPAMSRSLHVSPGRVGFLVTCYAAASFLAAIPLTAALRGLPRRPVLAGAPAAGRSPLRRVAAMPGIPAILTITVLLLLGHQALYTYLAPFARRAGLGQVSLVLFVFGIATVAGIWIVGTVIDRHLRPALLTALTLVAGAMLGLGLLGRSPAVLLVAVACWGAALGGAPTLLQTALVRVSGPGNADVATSMQATVYNIGIAAGSAAGGITLQSAGAGALPWVALPLVTAALVAAALATAAVAAGRITTCIA